MERWLEGHLFGQPNLGRRAVANFWEMLHTAPMSTTQLKAVVDKASPDERQFLEHYLAHLRRVADPSCAADLTRRMKDMDEGNKVRWVAVRKRAGLKAGGGR